MKRILAVLLALLMMSFSLIACDGDGSVDGKSYVFDDVRVEWADEDSESMLGLLGGLVDGLGASLSEMKAIVIEQYSQRELRFEDGKVSIGEQGEFDVAEYRQEGDDVFILSDGKIVMSLDLEDGRLVYEYGVKGIFEIEVIFKAK